MSIEVLCRCGKRLQAPDALAGSKCRCSSCGAVVRVPPRTESTTDDDLWEMAEAEQQQAADETAPSSPKNGMIPADAPAQLSSFEPARTRPRGPKRDRKKKRRRKKPLRISYAAALIYPLQGYGLLVILALGVLIAFGGCVPFVGFLFRIAAYAYIGVFFTETLHFSAFGIEEKPRFPELSFDALGVGMLWWLAMILAGIPFIFVLIVSLAGGMFTENSSPISAALLLAPFLLFTFVYQPMAVLAIAVQENWGALNPATVFRGIGRIPGPYLVLTLVVGIAMLAVGVARYLLEKEIFLIGALLSEWLWLYALAVLMRLTGALYYNNRRKFKGWH